MGYGCGAWGVELVGKYERCIEGVLSSMFVRALVFICVVLYRTSRSDCTMLSAFLHLYICKAYPMMSVAERDGRQKIVRLAQDW